MDVRFKWLSLLVLSGCLNSADRPLEKRWRAVAQHVDPVLIERGPKGAALVGEVNRAFGDPKSAPVISENQPPSPGKLSDELALRVVRSHLGAIHQCYDQEWELNQQSGESGRSGKLIVSLQIAPAGAVTKVQVDAPEWASHLSACIVGHVQTWPFPQVSEGPKNISLPLIFVGNS